MAARSTSRQWCGPSRRHDTSDRTRHRFTRMSRLDLPLDHITPYDRFALSDEDIERLLVSGELQRELLVYFGAAEYRDLARLARQAAATPVKEKSLRVIIVPGIM